MECEFVDHTRCKGSDAFCVICFTAPAVSLGDNACQRLRKRELERPTDLREESTYARPLGDVPRRLLPLAYCAE